MLSLAQLVPLYWRRHHAVGVFVVIALASGAQAVWIDMPLWSQAAFPIATCSVARYAAARWGELALVVGFVGGAVGTVDWLRGYYDDGVTRGAFTAYFFTIAAIVLAAWALGTLVRIRTAYVATLIERGERIEREAAQQIALSASAERARNAREMHDVVAHGLTTMVVQADGARSPKPP